MANIVRQICEGECKKSLPLNKFYKSNNKMFKNGKAPICTTCVKKSINYNDINTVYKILRQLDIPFVSEQWENSKRYKDVFGNYMRMINSLPQYHGLNWENSIFEKVDNIQEDLNVKDEPIKSKNQDFVVTDEIIERWNEGYTKEEYRQFEKKYNKLIRNYGEKTALHTEGLLSYIRFRVKEEMATARGDVKESKDWAALASKAATDAKINVSQLSKSDISGGVDVLAQLFEAVETEVGIIPLLPKVTAQPYDDADLVIWAIINYYRRLEDKPKVAYKEIYDFYDNMLQEHFDSQGFTTEQIEEYKAMRNNVFRDLEEVYKEPLYDTGDE